MTTITISRQFGSWGDEIARKVCILLGYHYFDKFMIAQAARESGLSEQEIIDYSEENYKVRNFLERLTGRSPAVAEVRRWREDEKGIRTVEEVPVSEEFALAMVQNAILRAHEHGNVVIIGRGGQALLKDMDDVLHIRIEAPLEMRIIRVREHLDMDGHPYGTSVDVRRLAQDMIVRKDAASEDYLRRFYNIDWSDPLLYHLVINTGRLGIEQSALLIARLASEIMTGEHVPVMPF